MDGEGERENPSLGKGSETSVHHQQKYLKSRKITYKGTTVKVIADHLPLTMECKI